VKNKQIKLNCQFLIGEKCCSKTKLTSIKVMKEGLGKHAVVLKLRLAKSRAVLGDDHHAGCTGENTKRQKSKNQG
jgi:hypothetical protein